MTYEDIVVSVENGVATIAINRPENANKLRFQTARELLEALRHVRETPTIDVAVLTGTGDKFFCIGGEHEELDSLGLLERDARHRSLRVHRHHAEASHRRRQRVRGGRRERPPRRVRPRRRRAPRRVPAGRSDGRELRRRLRHLVPRRDDRPSSRQGDVVPQPQVLGGAGARDGPRQRDRRRSPSRAPRRSPRPSASEVPSPWRALKTAFSGRHTGVAGQARLAHDLLLTAYRSTQEAEEMSASFEQRREPDRSKFYR